MPTIIQLPDERAEQLRALSKARNMPITDLIGEYIEQQIKAGHLPAGVPGFGSSATATP